MNQNTLDFDNDITESKLYTYQPYDFKGNPSLAVIDTILYKSPDSVLLEGLGIGYRGMSGAIATKKGHYKSLFLLGK